MHKHLFLLLLGLPAAAAAQDLAPDAAAPPPVAVSGSISTGVRQIGNDTDSAKLTEYRDLTDGAYVPSISLNVLDSRNGRYAEFSGSDLTLRDQRIVARGGMAGVWRVGLQWNDIPHNLSNRAQSPYIQRSPGLFEVPATVPITFKRLATAAADTPGVLASDELMAQYQRTFLRGIPLANDTSDGRISFDWTGGDLLALSAAYGRRSQYGQKWTFGPIGDRPPRTLNIQLTEPVDWRNQELTLSTERVSGNYTFQVSYLFSDFANDVDTLVWQNIYTTAAPDATYDVWDRAVSTYGRRPLEPDNRYHNASVAIGRDLPRDSRLTATLSYGSLRQNEPLLPYSYNVDVLANPALPRGTAQASMNTVQVLLDYAITPMPRLNVRAWTRHYGLDNNTPEANWHYVTSDTTNLNGTVSYKNKRVNLAYGTDRTNAGAEASYRLRRWGSTAGLRYEVESISRKFREADTVENRVAFTYRARPHRGVNLRGRYVFGVRNGTYDPFVPAASYWYEPAEANDADDPRFTFSNHPDMRRYDVSDRRRSQVEAMLTWTPGELFSLSTSVRYRGDDYDSDVAPIQPLAGTGFPGESAATPGLQLGLTDDRRTRYAVDAFVLPLARLSLTAFVAMDAGDSRQRSLEFNENNKRNPGVVETAELGPWTRASSQWSARTDDRLYTVGFSSTIGIVEERVSLTGSYTLSAGNMDITYEGFGVVNWTGAPFPPNHQFAFSTPPRINQDWHVADLRLQLPLFARTIFTLGYVYERYRTDDWMQSANTPWFEPVGSEYLLRDTSRSFQWGNRLFNFGTFLAPSYNAHIGYASFAYRF
jgi:MtrB/PioB family decaheme-associated outer membrane protein